VAHGWCVEVQVGGVWLVRGGAGCWHCWFSGLWKRVWGTWCMKDMDGYKVEVLFGKNIVLGSNGSVGWVR